MRWCRSIQEGKTNIFVGNYVKMVKFQDLKHITLHTQQMKDVHASYVFCHLKNIVPHGYIHHHLL